MVGEQRGPRDLRPNPARGAFLSPTGVWGAMGVRSDDLLPYVGRFRCPHSPIADGWGRHRGVATGGQAMGGLPDGPLSLWLDQYGEYTAEPAVEGEVDVDVAVIGGGLTGLATTVHLKRQDPSVRVAVLEAKTVGYGASGRNGSFAMTVIGLGFGTTALLRGKDFLRRAHTYMERCVDELEHFIDEDRLDCAKIRPGFLRVATAPSYVTRLQKQVELMRSLGFDGIDWIDAAATRRKPGRILAQSSRSSSMKCSSSSTQRSM